MQKITRISYEGGAALWFKETFRTHGAKEYAEFFTRGTVAGEKDGVNQTYPWFYARVLFLCFVLFSVFAFVNEFTYGVMAGMGHPVLVLLGAMLINAPATVLLYELYPARDLSFLKLLIVFIVGAAVADILINLGYYFVSTPNEWLSIAWTAFLEEASKAIPAILAIVILKTKNPLQCFVIGAAVGAGMSVSEDMGYIFFGSVTYEISVSSAVTMSFLRALTSISGHLLWTGLICWAFGKFRRPLIDIRFWGVCLGSMALHYIWDFPLSDVAFFTLIGAFVGGLVIFVLLIRKERSEFFYKARGAREDTEYISDGIKERQLPSFEPVRGNYNGFNLTAVFCAAVICACGLLFCTVGKRGGYDQLYFYDDYEFIYFVQCGEELICNDERPFDELAEDYSVYTVDGETVEITQREAYGGRNYYYTYGFDGEVYLSDIAVEVDGELYSCSTFGDAAVYYYKINPKVVDCYYDAASGQYAVFTYSAVTYNTTINVIAGALAGVAFAVGLGAFVCGLITGRKQLHTEEGKENEETTV